MPRLFIALPFDEADLNENSKEHGSMESVYSYLNQYNKELKEGYQSLLKLSGVGQKIATALYEMGFRSAEDIAKVDEGDLVTVKGISEKNKPQYEK